MPEINRNYRLLTTAALTGAMLLVAACASTPRASLNEAKLAIEAAESADASHYATAELDEARQKPANAWESGEPAEARLLTHQAALALTHAAVEIDRAGPSESSSQLVAEAIEKAQRAVALREKIAAEGGQLPSAYAYMILAHALHAGGQADKVAGTMEKARQASLANPE